MKTTKYTHICNEAKTYPEKSTKKECTYKELLTHPKWQRKRLQIFERDEWGCQTCGNKEETLHCHHIKYVYGNNPWEYPNENFVTLCKHCHKAIERAKKQSITFFMDTTTIIHGENTVCLVDKSPRLLFQTDKEMLYFEGPEVENIFSTLSKILQDD